MLINILIKNANTTAKILVLNGYEDFLQLISVFFMEIIAYDFKKLESIP